MLVDFDNTYTYVCLLVRVYAFARIYRNVFVPDGFFPNCKSRE